MHLHTRNVNTAFAGLVNLFLHEGRSTRVDPGTGSRSDSQISIVKRPSRNGNVMMIDEPVTITYSHPRERVLFNKARDCNPFFHLYEALWMLAGRNDVDPLAYYASKMKDFSDDGRTFNGAYGYRWRKAFAYPDDQIDQLDKIVEHLKADPNSRRAVLAMWNVEDDLLKITTEPDPKCLKCGGTGTKPQTESTYCQFCSGTGRARKGKPASKDVCCNLNAMFSLRKGLCPPEQGCKDEVIGQCPANPSYLDMTVTNRSNDMIWGMLGANYVHFTFLQEYMAARLGCEVGKYNHITNNLHVYDWNWKPTEWLEEYEGMKGNHEYDGYQAEGGIQLHNHIPLIKNPVAFEKELPQFVKYWDGSGNNKWFEATEPFLLLTAWPMMAAFTAYKNKDYPRALYMAEQVEATDWMKVAVEWIARRSKVPT